MVSISLGVRRIRKTNYTRVISIPLPWLRDRGIETGGPVSCRIDEAGSLVLTALKDEEEEIVPEAQGRVVLAGGPAPVPPNVTTKGAR